jgi:hypothetical protein
MLRDLALVIAAAIVTVVVAEFGVRIYQRQPLWPVIPPKPYIDSRLFYLKSPTLLYEMRPGIDDEIGYERIRITIDRSGFRDTRDPVVPKPPGTWRAVVLGDSFTFSGKVPLEKTFAAQLEALLAKRDPSRRYEVWNLGVPGYKSAQQLAVLREKGMPLDPDLVIEGVTLNIAAPLVQLVPATEPRWPRLNRFIKRFHLVQFLYANWKRYGYRWRGGLLHGEENFADLTEDSARWKSSKADLGEMKRITEAGGGKFFAIMWPMFVDLDDYPYRAKHQLVMDACRERGIAALDLFPIFEGMAAPSLWVKPDDHHPNPIAQQKVAESVLGALEGQGLLPR